jgi:hypothetical protein
MLWLVAGLDNRPFNDRRQHAAPVPLQAAARAGRTHHQSSDTSEPSSNTRRANIGRHDSD